MTESNKDEETAMWWYGTKTYRWWNEKDTDEKWVYWFWTIVFVVLILCAVFYPNV